MEASAGRVQYKDFKVNSEQETDREVQEMNTINKYTVSQHKCMFKYRKRGLTMLISVSPNVVFLQNLCFGVEMMLTLSSLL